MAGNCGSVCPAAGGFYSYDPNQGGSAIFLVLFALLALPVLYLGIRSTTFLFSAVLTTGLLAEVLGFIGRILLHFERDNQTYFFLFMLGTVLGPTFIGISIYIVLPHVLGIYGDPISPIRPLLVGIVFWSLAAVSLIIEFVGVIITAYAHKHQHSGVRTVAAGAGIQAFTLLSYSCLHFWFTVGLSTHRGSLDARHYYVYTSSAFKRMVIALELASILLIIYSIYTVVTFADGLPSTIFQSEPAFMVIGGAVPLLACILLTVFHPGRIFGRAWAETTPRGLATSTVPSPILHPSGQPIHPRYDPDIRKQISPASRRSPNVPNPPPTGFPGLPATPKPSSKSTFPGSPSSSVNNPDRTTTQDIAPPQYSFVPARRQMVDNEQLW